LSKPAHVTLLLDDRLPIASVDAPAGNVRLAVSPRDVPMDAAGDYLELVARRDGIVAAPTDRVDVGIIMGTFSPAGKPLRVAPSPARRVAAPPLGRRSWLELRDTGILLRSDLRLPADDRWLRAFESGAIDRNAVFERYAPIALAVHANATALCCGSVSFERDGGGAHVHLERLFSAQNSGLVPAHGGDVTITRIPYTWSTPSAIITLPDELTVRVRDYAIEKRGGSIDRDADHELHLRWGSPPADRLDVATLTVRPEGSAQALFLRSLRAPPPTREALVAVVIVGGLITIAPLVAWCLIVLPSARRCVAPVATLTTIALLGSLNRVAALVVDALGFTRHPWPGLSATALWQAIIGGAGLAAALLLAAQLGRARNERWSASSLLMRLLGVSAAGILPFMLIGALAREHAEAAREILLSPLALASAALALGIGFVGVIPARIRHVTWFERVGAWLPPLAALAVLAIRNPFAIDDAFIDPSTVASYVTDSVSCLAFAAAALIVTTHDSAGLNWAIAVRWKAALLLALGLGTAYPLVASFAPLSLALSVPLLMLLLRDNDAGAKRRIPYAALFEEGLRRVDLDRARRALRRIDENVYSPDSDPERDKARSQALQARIESLTQTSLGDLDGAALAFGGPMLGSPAHAARAGFAVGGLAGLGLVLLNASSVARTLASSPVPALTVSATLAETIASQALAGATFAFLVHRLRGRTSLVKAVLVVAAMTVATAPATLLVGDLRLLMTRALAQIVILGAVGAVADGWVLRRVTQPWFSTARLFGLAGLGAYAAAGAILIGSIGSAATGALSDVVTQAVKRVVSPPLGSGPEPGAPSVATSPR
jgi:hypothetical protein